MWVIESDLNEQMWYVGDLVIVSCAICSFLLVGNFTPCSRVTYVREVSHACVYSCRKD